MPTPERSDSAGAESTTLPLSEQGAVRAFQRAKSEERRAIGIAVDVCTALAEIHSRGIIHRDLKPSNLFMTPQSGGKELCRLLDFGVAKWVAETGDPCVGESAPSTAVGHVIGSVSYMPPEQLRGDQSIDGRADLYALGAILYEALSGKRPYRGENAAMLSYHILHEQRMSTERSQARHHSLRAARRSQPSAPRLIPRRRRPHGVSTPALIAVCRPC